MSVDDFVIYSDCDTLVRQGNTCYFCLYNTLSTTAQVGRWKLENLNLLLNYVESDRLRTRCGEGESKNLCECLDC